MLARMIGLRRPANREKKREKGKTVGKQAGSKWEMHDSEHDHRAERGSS